MPRFEQLYSANEELRLFKALSSSLEGSSKSILVTSEVRKELEGKLNQRELNSFLVEI